MTQYKYKINGHDYAVTIESVSDSSAKVTVNGKTYDVELDKSAEESAAVEYPRIYRPLHEKAQAAPQETRDCSLKSPLPGTIIAVMVKEGQQVKEGQTVAILEAMKMENEILAESDGTVESVNVEKGDSVLEGTVIATIR